MKRIIRNFQNEQNSNKVKLGDTKDSLLEIMQQPDTIYVNFLNSGNNVLYYEPLPFSSGGRDIYLDKNEKVVKIIHAY